MFSASYFTYDGVFSGQYGLMIADFNAQSVSETPVFQPSIKTHKTVRSNRFFYNGITYEALPQYTFSILSEAEIPDVVRREILSWLVGREGFRRLSIHQDDLENYWYNCIFTDVHNIYVHGRCHGFRLTANFDSPYQRGKSSEVDISDSAVAQTVYIDNKSDIVDDYTYPLVEITSGDSISITNLTDDSARIFSFHGSGYGDKLTIDNELKMISSGSGAALLGGFNKNWLRLRKGVNELSVTTNGSCRIICPTYVMIGF